MKTKTVRIENWSFGMHAETPYDPPEIWVPRFNGDVYGYPGRADGENILTSALIGYDDKTGEFICQSRRYVLGKADAPYEAMFPGAKERIVISAKKLNKGS